MEVQAAASIDFADPPQGLFHEEWMEIFLAEDKVGYLHFQLARKNGLVFSNSNMRFAIRRGPIAIEIFVDAVTSETVGGEPRTFQTIIKMADQPLEVSGAITGDWVAVNFSQLGMVQTRRYPWTPGAVMVWGAAREAFLQGYEAGTTYDLMMYTPDVKQDGPIPVTVVVGPLETLTWKETEIEAIRVSTTLDLEAGSLTQLTWVDGQGRTLKSSLDMAGMKLSMMGTDQAQALSEFVPADMFEYALLAVDRSIPPSATEVTYILRLQKELSHAPQILQTRYQRARQLGPNSFLVTVRRADHDLWSAEPAETTESSHPGREYVLENAFLNTQDPELLKLAGEITAPTDDPILMAHALREFSSAFISNKSLAVGFASASEVARRRSGDCTEHAVLLAALARLKGIPSRIVTGLAYLSEYEGRRDVFGFHMWTQIWIRGHWVDFDAALGESECSPTRIALHATSLEFDSLAESSLAVMDLIGQIEIGVDKVVD